MLNPLVILGLGGALHAMGHAIMVPLYWAVSGLIVLFHYLWSPLFGRDSGISWTLAIVCLTIFIRLLLVPLFVKQINSARSMQLIQPKMKASTARKGSTRRRPVCLCCCRCQSSWRCSGY